MDDDQAVNVGGQNDLKEIESVDVIRVVLQFLKENSLLDSFDTLTRETGVHLNTLEDPALLTSAIRAGEWDTVLREVAMVELSDAVQQNLFEHIALEMLDMRELDTARKILRSSRALRQMQSSNPERYGLIEGIFQRGMVAAHEWPSGSKKKNRKALSKAVVGELSVVPPSRLLSIIGQGLRWQRHMGMLPPGTAFNLFRDKAPAPVREEEVFPSAEMSPLIFAKECRPLACAFSPDGQSLATGSSDGFVEVWNWMQGKLRTDLGYQAKDELMMHASEVLCMAWSRDSELLATGDAKGVVKIWQVGTGKCLRRFKSAHEKGVTCVAWSSDSSKVVTSSLDGTARMHGLLSGKTVKFFRGHSSYVNRCLFAAGGIVTCSTDGTIRLWDKKSSDCTKTLTVADLEDPTGGSQGQAVGVAPKHAAVVDMVHGRDKEGIIACNRSNVVYRFHPMSGELQHRYVVEDSDVEFYRVAVSSLGRFLFAGTTNGHVVAFNYETGAVEHQFPALAGELARMDVHPHMNVLCCLPVDGNKASLWRPSSADAH